MKKETKERVFIVLLILILMGWSWFGFFYLPDKQKVVEKQGIITDKYTEVNIGSTVYKIEIDNDTIIGLTRNAWNGYEIGDTYNWSEIIWEW